VVLLGDARLEWGHPHWNFGLYIFNPGGKDLSAHPVVPLLHVPYHGWRCYSNWGEGALEHILRVSGVQACVMKELEE
jgi:hypothetical protein